MSTQNSIRACGAVKWETPVCDRGMTDINGNE